MNRSSLALLCLLAAGCAGQASRGASAAPAPDEQPAPPPPMPSELATLTALPDVPAVEDLAEALRSVDSADMAVLEELSAARPDSGDLAVAASHGHGGPNALGGVSWDIDVETFGEHDRVQYYLDFFQTKGRERMTVWLGRMPRYEPMIRQAMQEHGLPGDMIYLALIESGFSNRAVSRARATGMWQFMKGTAKLYGLRVDHWVDDRRDPMRATAAAARHLADLRAQFGSLYLAAAAYNAGPGRVTRGLRRLPDDPSDEEETSDATFFRLYDTKHLRRETKDYVPKLIAAALIAKEPTKYGFPEIPEAPPLAYDSMLVTDATSLDVVADLAGTTHEAILELNGRYLRGVTPPGAKAWVRVPEGRADAAARGYATLPPSKRITFREHVVAKGETLGEIARAYRVSLAALEGANPTVRPRALRIGQRLIIPAAGYAAPARAAAPRVAAELRPASGGSIHRVRRGDSLWSIARRYGVTEQQLRAWNGLDGSKLLVGQRIRVSPN